MITDADWNEQADMTRYRAEREARDTIGACGAPVDAAGFALVAETNALAVHALERQRRVGRRRGRRAARTLDGGATWTLVDCGPPPTCARSRARRRRLGRRRRRLVRRTSMRAQLDRAGCRHAHACAAWRCSMPITRGPSATAASSSRRSTAARRGASCRPMRRGSTRCIRDEIPRSRRRP